jgi:hypothetical protein
VCPGSRRGRDAPRCQRTCGQGGGTETRAAGVEVSKVERIRQLVVAPHGWGSWLGVWTRPPAQPPKDPGVEVCAAMDAVRPQQRKRSRIVWARGDREWSLNDGQLPNFRAVRVALGTGYNRVEGNRQASRNGPVSVAHPESVALRFATFPTLSVGSMQGAP